MSCTLDQLRHLQRHAGELPAGERSLVDYLAHLPTDRWDQDCEVIGLYILDRHRPKLPDLGVGLPPIETDLGVIVPAAERIRRKAESWQQGQTFAQQVIADLDSVGGTRMVIVVLPRFHPRLVEELKEIPGYQYQRTFKQHTKAALYPTSSAVEVVRWCRRHHVAASPALEELAGPVGEQLDEVGNPDITLTDDGWLRVTFPFDWHTVHDLKETIPPAVRRYDRIGEAWLVRVENLGDVIAFADRWMLRYTPQTLEQARALREVS